MTFETQQPIQSLATLIESRQQLLSRIDATAIVVRNNDDLAGITQIQNPILKLIREIETHRKGEVDPRRKEIQDIDKSHMEAASPLIAMNNKIEDAKKTYQRQEAERVFKERQAAQEAARLELERHQEQERLARAAQLKAEQEAAAALKRQQDAEKAGDLEAAKAAEEEATWATLEASQAAEKADNVAPLVPVAVAKQVESRVTTIKSESGTQSSGTKLSFRLASEAESNLETSHIPPRFWRISDPEFKSEVTIGKLVRSKAWTKDVQLSAMEFTIKECPGIIVVEDIKNTVRLK